MASRLPSRRWILRDIPLTYGLFVWLAFGFSVVIYFIDWSPARPATSASPQQKAAATTQLNNASDDPLYTGSILFPSGGDLCWERMLDNRTGRMWDKGYVDCRDLLFQSSRKHSAGGLGTARVRAIGNALLHKSEK